MGNRMSSLPIALHCGLSPRLDEQHGSGRRALISKAFHARMSKSEDWEHLWARLTDDEKAECDGWHEPKSFELAGKMFHYKDAYVEVEVGLTSDLQHCDANHPDLISLGHMDFGWKPVYLDDGMKVVPVVDAKKTRWTSPIDTLQLDAYGFAWASYWEADAYWPAIWVLDEGVYEWRDEPVSLFDPHLAAIKAEQIRSAALNLDGKATTGHHCSGCYQRMRCPEHLMPAALASANEAWKPFVEPDGLNPDNALEALRLTKALKDAADVMEKQLKAFAERTGGVPDGDGKIWKLVRGKTPGARFDKKGLEAQHPEIAQKFTIVTKPRDQFRWVNDRR